jgi:uncharacterized membrane protein SirB2
MIETLMVVLFTSFFSAFVIRNFYIQLIALKLFLDTLVLAMIVLRAPNQQSTVNQAAAWLVASLGMILFFILLAVSVRRFATVRRVEERA